MRHDKPPPPVIFDELNEMRRRMEARKNGH